jgi:tryptophan-rich sensory protein
MPLGIGPRDLLPNLVYYCLIVAGFTWVVAPFGPSRRLRTVYRLCIAAVISTIAMLATVQMGAEGGIASFVNQQVDGINTYYTTLKPGASPPFNVDSATNIVVNLLYKGGALASVMLFFYVSRQIAGFIGRIIGREERKPCLESFHAGFSTIWFLLGALVVSALAFYFKKDMPEILALNLGVLCCLLYLGQGWGMVLSFLARHSPRRPSGLFLPTVIFLVCVMGFNAIFLAALALMGIVENFLPLKFRSLRK